MASELLTNENHVDVKYEREDRDITSEPIETVSLRDAYDCIRKSKRLSLANVILSSFLCDWLIY